MRRTLRPDYRHHIIQLDGIPMHVSQLSRGNTESGSDDGIGIKLRRAEKSNLSSIVARGLANIRTANSGLATTRGDISSVRGGELGNGETERENCELRANDVVLNSDSEEGRRVGSRGTRYIDDNRLTFKHNTMGGGEKEEKADSEVRFGVNKAVA
jgi:hypothetical protein